MSVSSVDSLADSGFEDSIETKNENHREQSPLIKKSSQLLLRQHEPVPRRAPVGSLPRVDEADDEDEEDPLLEVMDRIEDEVDGNFYNDLVPLHVKLALEENVFGWSHLMSDIFGHIMFTAGYYAITYIFITQVCWKRNNELRLNMSEDFFRSLRIILSVLAGLSGFRTVRRRRKVWLRAPYGTQEYEKDELRRRQSVEESDRTTLLGRIRQRRDGWLERRVQRKLFKASDRFEKRMKHKTGRVVRVLHPRSDAEFSNRGRSASDGEQSVGSSSRTKRKPRFRTDRSLGLDQPAGRRGHTGATENIESIAHDQILFKPGPILNVPYAHGGFFGAAPFMLANPYWIDILRHLMPDVYVEISRRVVHAQAPNLIHWAENNPVVAAYGTAHELEYNGRVPNIEWDVFLDPHLVKRVEVVLDERDKFLKSCAPSSTELNNTCEQDFAVEATISMTQGERTIHRYYEAEIRRRTQVLVDRMLIAHGNLTQLIWEQTGIAKKYNFSRIKRTRRTLGGGIFARQWLAVYAEALKMGMCDDDEVTATTQEDRSIDWTGSSDSDISTTASSDDEPESDAQATGCSSSEGGDNNLTKLKKSSSETCLEDLETPTKAPLSISYHSNRVSPLKGDPFAPEIQGTPPTSSERAFARKHSTSLFELAGSKCPDTSITKSIAMLKNIMQCNAPVGLFLDIKSRHVSKRIWALVVDALREAGARVEAVASFYSTDIKGVSDYCSTPVKEVIFFHSAGDLQQACHDGTIQRGDIALFNGGSLLWDSPEHTDLSTVRKTLFAKFDPMVAKGKYKFLPCARVTSSNGESSEARQLDGSITSHDRDRLLADPGLYQGGSTIQYYKEKFDLSIGLYVQEFSIDEAALNMLVKLVNENPHIYNLGLSWGGVNGVTVRGIQPGRFTNTDGFWNQRYLGAVWDPCLFPPERSATDSVS